MILLVAVIKKKYCVLQEEREQVDGFQTQEMAKLKHLVIIVSTLASILEELRIPPSFNLGLECLTVLVSFQLLAKEQDIASKVSALKESNAQIQTLQIEVSRLRRYEEELSTLQVRVSQILPNRPLPHLLHHV